MPRDFWRCCRLWQVMNNGTKCCGWPRKRPTGQKQSRGKFACCKITSKAGRSNATFAAQYHAKSETHASRKMHDPMTQNPRLLTMLDFPREAGATLSGIAFPKSSSSPL